MRISSTLVVTAALALVATAGPAYAEGDGRPVEKRNFMVPQISHWVDGVGMSGDPSRGSTFGWVDGQDSPTDSNERALQAVLVDSGPGAHDFTVSWTRKALRMHTPVTELKNVSLEVDEAPQPGQISFGVRFRDNSYALIDVSDCLADVPGSTWQRVDFTGATSGCAFTLDGTVYAADGTSSAWAAYAAAHPQRLVQAIMVQIDGPGTFLLDRIAIGTNRMYNQRGRWAVRCGWVEARC
jgi:hypothetical protein